MEGGGVEEAGLVLAAALLAVCVAMLALVLRRLRQNPIASLVPRFDQLAAAQDRTERALREELACNREELTQSTRHLREEVGGTIRAVGETVEKRLDDVRGVIDRRLQPHPGREREEAR